MQYRGRSGALCIVFFAVMWYSYGKYKRSVWRQIMPRKGKIMREVYDFLKKCGTYYLATVEDDQPRVRPFGTVEIFEDKLYIQTGKAKPVSK